jgi:hypothetical protein
MTRGSCSEGRHESRIEELGWAAVAKLGVIVLGKEEMELRVCYDRWKYVEGEGLGDVEARG